MDSLAETLRQLAFLGALLAGFAISLLASLFTAPHNRRSVTWTAAAAMMAAACLIISTVAGVAGAVYITDRPDLRAKIVLPSSAAAVPPEVQFAVVGALRWSATAFLLGIIALLVSLGLSGWIRSRKMGIFSSVLAGGTLFLLLCFLRFVVTLL